MEDLEIKGYIAPTNYRAKTTTKNKYSCLSSSEMLRKGFLWSSNNKNSLPYSLFNTKNTEAIESLFNNEDILPEDLILHIASFVDNKAKYIPKFVYT